MKREAQKKAVVLRKKGKSIREIAALLKVSKASVSSWVRDVELTDTQKSLLQSRNAIYNSAKGTAAHASKRKADRETFQKEGVLKAQEKDPLHIMGAMLFWAEGAKRGNAVTFCNSDPDMVKLFIRFLRECYDVSTEQFRVHVHCHSEDPEEVTRIESFWQKETGLYTECFGKTVLNRVSVYSKKKRRKNKLPYGVCKVSVFSVKITQSIYGAIQTYGEFKNHSWLSLK